LGSWRSYGAREYDASVGRFFGVDPVIEKFPWVTPYNYAENEPVGHIDLWGLQKAKPSLREFWKNAMKWFGLDGNTLRNGPSSQEHANQISANRAKFQELGEGASTILDIQTAFIPGGTLLNPNSTNSDYAIEAATFFFPIGKIGKALKSVKALSFSSVERKVIHEASEILTSKEFSNMVEAGLDADINIGNYTINFRPNASFSGFTSYAENSFVIGGDALKFDNTGEELTKTILHELFRLNTSLFKGGRTVSPDHIINAGYNSMQEVFEAETRAAQKFSDDVFNKINN